MCILRFRIWHNLLWTLLSKILFRIPLLSRHYKRKNQTEESDAYFALLETVVDKFHDFYHLDSKQRRYVSKALMDRHLSLVQLQQLHDEGRTAVPKPSAPAPHIAIIHSGPYPVKADAGPEVISQPTSPRAGLHKNWLDAYRANQTGSLPGSIDELALRYANGFPLDQREEAYSLPPTRPASPSVEGAPASEGPMATPGPTGTPWLPEGPHLRGSLEQHGSGANHTWSSSCTGARAGSWRTRTRAIQTR